jgi:hypothetical protein
MSKAFLKPILNLVLLFAEPASSLCKDCPISNFSLPKRTIVIETELACKFLVRLVTVLLAGQH